MKTRVAIEQPSKLTSNFQMLHAAANFCNNSSQVATTDVGEVASDISVSKLFVVDGLRKDPKGRVRVVYSFVTAARYSYI